MVKYVSFTCYGAVLEKEFWNPVCPPIIFVCQPGHALRDELYVWPRDITEKKDPKNQTIPSHTKMIGGGRGVTE